MPLVCKANLARNVNYIMIIGYHVLVRSRCKHVYRIPGAARNNYNINLHHMNTFIVQIIRYPNPIYCMYIKLIFYIDMHLRYLDFDGFALS